MNKSGNLEDAIKSQGAEGSSNNLLISGQAKAIANRRSRKNSQRAIHFTGSVPTMNQALTSPMQQALNLDLYDAIASRPSSTNIIGGEKEIETKDKVAGKHAL